MVSIELNSAHTQCGQILLSVDSFSMKGKILLNCSFCEDEFNTFPAYTNHLLLQHYPQIELEDCNQKLERSNMHVEDSCESGKDSTNECTNEFIKFLQMDFHKNDNLLDVNRLIEKNDMSSIPTKQQLQNESIINGSNIKYDKNKKCPHCEREFFLSSSLKEHLARHRKLGGSIGGLYKCKLCKSEFDLRFSLMLHMREHQLSKNTVTDHVERKNLCLTPSRRPRLMKKALNRNNVKPVTIRKSNQTHTKPFQDETPDAAVEPEEFHCEICNKKFCGQPRFNAHMNRHKPCEFKCSTCSKEFKTAGELQTHTRFHTGERPYLCANCGETFSTVSKLINHTRRHHTFERTKQCPICKKKFYGSGELKVHLQSTHSNERPYKCKICPATFNRPFSLRTHMKSHENKREYKCNFCPASFNQKCNLTAHKKKAHCLLTDDEKRV